MKPKNYQTIQVQIVCLSADDVLTASFDFGEWDDLSSRSGQSGTQNYNGGVSIK